MELTQVGQKRADRHETSRFTVLGLFDDAIDAELTLVALRRAERPAEQVSVLVRDRAADAGTGPERHGEVARAVVANALNAVSGWLLGLASLIVPENGTYLVAGPIGAALAGVRTIEGRQRQRALDGGGEEYTEITDLSLGGLSYTLTEFGFRPDEAAYLQSRLTAGSALIAVTTSDTDQLHATRRLFADHSAVHIGQAETGEVIVHEAEELLAAPPEEAVGDVVVADAVAPLRFLCSSGSHGVPAPPICGAVVFDAVGEETGQLEDLLAEGSPTAAVTPIVRYAVIGFGGLLGLGRHRIAIPAEQVDLQTDPIRLTVTKDVLRRAPAYEPDMPFSRREEMAVHAYFGTTPYWLK
ncbi:MAG: hypothetical protein QOF33_952 [Thermomicrobiales bacterium]|jgi:hypothetical protein|nr:hypothetical protein [Thermomicrobiales bacterium]